MRAIQTEPRPDRIKVLRCCAFRQSDSDHRALKAEFWARAAAQTPRFAATGPGFFSCDETRREGCGNPPEEWPATESGLTPNDSQQFNKSHLNRCCGGVERVVEGGCRRPIPALQLFEEVKTMRDTLHGSAAASRLDRKGENPQSALPFPPTNYPGHKDDRPVGVAFAGTSVQYRRW